MMRSLRDLWRKLAAPRAAAAVAEDNAQPQQETAERQPAAVERARPRTAERAQARRQAALLRLSAELAATLEESEICRRVVDGLQDTLGYEYVACFLLEKATGDRVHVASVGFVEPPPRLKPGEGLSERALLDGQLHYTPDVTADPRYVPGLHGSEVDVPVRIGGEVRGVLITESRQTDAFDQEDFEVLTAAAQQAGLAIEKARLLAAERQRADELDALRTTMADITAELELSALLQAIVERAARLLDATGGELGLVDEASQEIRIVVSHNLGRDYVGTRHALGEGVMGRVIQAGEPLIIEDYSAWEGGLAQYSHVHATLAAPLKVGGRLVGAFTTVSTDPARQFGAADLHLHNMFAQQAAIAIENARLYEQAQREIAERVRAEGELRKYQEHLEELVEERTAELRESEERYRTLFDGVPVGLYRTTPAGQMVDANPALVHMLGYSSREELLTINPASLYVDPEGRARWQALMEREGTVRDFETRIRRHDDAVIWVNDTARAVKDEQGQVLYYEGSLEDITERKQAEAELRKYQEHLEELVEERTAELRESEERYRTLFDGVPVGLYRTTPAGEFMDFNLGLVQMLGYPSRQHLMAINTASLYVDPEDRVRWQALMEREGVVRDFEVRLRRYDGTVIWVNDTARAVRDEQGQVLYYEGSIEDITARKEFEAEIRRQKEYFVALFVNSPVAVVTADLDANVVSWNPMAEKLFCYTQEEAIGKNLDDLVAKDESIRAEALGYSVEVIEVGRVQVTTRRTRKDGSLVDVELLALPLILAGEKVGFIAIYHDITERKMFEEEIRRQKEYFEALFVNSPVAVLTVDLDVNVVSWNPMAEKLFGYTQEEAIGRNLDDLVANDPRIWEEAVSYTRHLFTVGAFQATAKRTRKDGSLVDVEVLALPVVVAGEEVGYIGIYHDITELQQARRAAEAANQAKSVFLANMSHELRTPLNAILGFTQLMDRDPNLTAEQQENLGIINRSGEHLLALINDVLEMSKIEAGRVTLQETSFDLYRLLDGLEEMFDLRAKDTGLTLSFERAENVPQYVRADEGKLRQVLSNLLGNAVKFTQEGGVALRVGCREYGGRRGQEPFSGLLPTCCSILHFEVEDTGPGIGPEELAVLFDPFVQATTGQRSQEGTGLGLSISRQYVRLMGGDITVSSELGRGSVFKFDIKVETAKATDVQAERPARQVIGLEPGQAVYRLLIVDERPEARQLLVKLLEPLGFELREAVNGQEAIEMWERWEPHLIWMDMRMPVMDGYEATRRIKATAKGRATTIVALTATAFEEDRERVLSEGCDDFVRKPFREDEIFDTLTKHLGVRFVYEEIPAAIVRPGEAVASSVDVLTPAALADLPAGWLTNLRRATVKADLDRILTLIDQIRGENAALADGLAELARDFQYKKILRLIDRAGEER
ncbi:MAG: PAS domain S-box protein [Anaerolineae bacterium]|nr:PAS domain S-box protein [Anaerolineae bacterium]